MRRLLLFVFVFGLGLTVPGLALGHAGTTAGTDYRSDIRSVPAGVEARIAGGDDRLVLTRTTATEVVVLGYGDEPYLRLDSSGVWENRASPAVALNAERMTADPLAGADGPPDWVRVSTGDMVAFHDHRAHWMGSQAPATVREDPDRTQLLFDWSVPLVIDGAPAAILGDVTWLGAPLTWLWWSLTVLVAAIGLGVGLIGRRHSLALAAIGTGLAIGTGTLIGISKQLDLPAGGRGALLALAIAGLLVLAAAAGAFLTRGVPAHAATILLLVAVIAGGMQLAGVVEPAFAYGLVPGLLPTLLTRLLIIVGIAGVLLAIGACAGAWRDLLGPMMRDTPTVSRSG